MKGIDFHFIRLKGKKKGVAVAATPQKFYYQDE
jgi:hypothetical protein